MSGTQARRAWYAITLDRVLVVLLVVVGLLFLSDRYDWFAFNRRKGWTVLIAVAVVAGVLSLTGLWTMLNWVMSRWIKVTPFQFGLRSGLVLVAVVGLVCGWLGGAIQQARQQEEICAAIKKAKGHVRYETLGKAIDVPEWLVDVMGNEFFVEVKEVGAIDDEGLRQAVQLLSLETLWLDPEIVGSFDPAIPAFSAGALSQIERLTRLKRLRLDAGKLSAQDLMGVRLPGKLEELELFGDNLDDSTLAMVGKLSELQSLRLDLPLEYLYGSDEDRRPLPFTDGGLRHLSGLAKLRELRLCNTNLTDGAFAQLQGLNELRDLSIPISKIDGSGLRSLQALPHLGRLDISCNQIVDDNLRHLRVLSNLRHLDIASAEVHGAGLEHVGQLAQLESLSLGESNSVGKHFLPLTQLHNLKTLRVHCWHPDGDMTKIIGQMEQLQELDLGLSQINDEMSSHLHSLKQLKSLTLREFDMSRGAIDALKKALPNCSISPR